MITRLANPGDHEAVFPMLRQLRLQQQKLDAALYQLHPDAEQRFLRWIGQVGEDPRSTLLVAEEQGQIVGFIYAVVERDLPIYLHAEFAVIHEWWVEPAFRRRGLRRALIDLAVKELARVGVRQLRVRTAVWDADVRSLLRRCDFRSGVCEMAKDLRPAKHRSEKQR
jgi:GNAT superfamily N-acetyltransferase